MHFTFLHYRLNTDFNLLKTQLSLIAREENLLQYIVINLPINNLLDFPIEKIALYFYENKLVTIYYRLNCKYSNWENVVKAFEKHFKSSSTLWEEDEGNVFNWEFKDEFLGIIANKKEDAITIYYTLNEFNVFADCF